MKKIVAILLVTLLQGCNTYRVPTVTYLASQPPPDFNHIAEPIDNKVSFTLFFRVEGLDEPQPGKEKQE